MEAGINSIIDAIIILLVKIIIPVDIMAKVIAGIVIKFKWLVLGTGGIVALICCLSFLSIITPVQAVVPVPNYHGLPEVLQDYLEEGYGNSPSPVLSPFGGKIGENTSVTAYFHDLNYFRSFGHWHEGMDLIPNSNYYRNNQADKQLGDVVVFATCSGSARSLRDSAGANYIYLLCNDGIYAVLIVHNKYNFISLGESAKVIAGQPVAVMGSTGHSTGPHVHYAIRDLRTGIYINPITFINNSQ